MYVYSKHYPMKVESEFSASTRTTKKYACNECVHVYFCIHIYVYSKYNPIKVESEILRKHNFNKKAQMQCMCACVYIHVCVYSSTVLLPISK